MCRQKNRNLFRRLIILLLPITCLLVLVTLTSCDKQEMIIKSWNLQSVLMNGEPLDDSLQFNVIPKYTYYSFSYANSLYVSTIAHNKRIESSDGFYKFASKSTIDMRFTLLYNRYDITANIKKLTRRELHLEYEDRGNNYYLKLYSN
jgi:hypothetical protein